MSPAPKEEKKEAKSDNSEILDVMKGISAFMGNLDARLKKIETGGKEDFKIAKAEADVALAVESRKSVDPRVSDIVNEILGEDFKVLMEPNKDRPGFMFTLIVPSRLSDTVKETRPKADPAGTNREYLKDKDGHVIMEEYTPEDRRSRAIAATDNFDAIRQHCERVRGYIVGYYQKVSKPLPEFKIK